MLTLLILFTNLPGIAVSLGIFRFHSERARAVQVSRTARAGRLSGPRRQNQPYPCTQSASVTSRQQLTSFSAHARLAQSNIIGHHTFHNNMEIICNYICIIMEKMDNLISHLF